MRSSMVIGIALMGVMLAIPADAKKPAAQDEAVIRGMIERLYAPYTKPMNEAPDDGGYAADNGPGAGLDGYELPYTASLGPLVTRWGALMQDSGELYNLNSFDWYCQCQDNDNSTAKLVSQSFAMKGKDRISVTVLYSPGKFEGKDSGAPLVFYFKQEDGAWKLDDMKFHRFTTLRKGLASDIKDATKAIKPKGT
jgi:hypothetical protein